MEITNAVHLDWVKEEESPRCKGEFGCKLYKSGYVIDNTLPFFASIFIIFYCYFKSIDHMYDKRKTVKVGMPVAIFYFFCV